MKLVIQRVSNAHVEVDNKCVGEIKKGFMVLLGVAEGDTKEHANYLAKKLCNLRVFGDENKRMNLSLKDVNGEVLVVSQFTLCADTSSGNRPSFTKAAKPDIANEIYEYFCNQCKLNGIEVKQGIFGANMKVSLVNDGPVTIIMER